MARHCLWLVLSAAALMVTSCPDVLFFLYSLKPSPEVRGPLPPERPPGCTIRENKRGSQVSILLWPSLCRLQTQVSGSFLGRFRRCPSAQRVDLSKLTELSDYPSGKAQKHEAPPGGAGVAQSAKRPAPDSRSGHDLAVREFEPCIRLCANSREPAWDSLPSVCSSPARPLSLSK